MENERLEKLANKFRFNDYETIVFQSKKEAKDYLLKICEGKSVGVGDSHTVEDLGVLSQLQQISKNLYAMGLDKSRPNKLNSLTADIFILSANAVAEDTGEMVNVDSSCNRVAPSLFGPSEVVFVIGVNKVEKDLISAISRVRNYVAPINSKVHNYNTPCIHVDKCLNCNSKDRICRATVIYHKRPKQTPTKVILINENLGW